MILVYQPEGSALCGQACLATILGISLEEACDILPGDRGTRICRIREALEKHGFTLGPRKGGNRLLERGKRYIGRVRWRPREHWGHLFLVEVDGRVLDPYFGPKDAMRWDQHPEAKVTSLYEIIPLHEGTGGDLPGEKEG